MFKLIEAIAFIIFGHENIVKSLTNSYDMKLKK